MLSQNKLTPPESKAAQKPNQRQSGIELLRIVSMFLVLLLHSLYYSLGRPTAEDYVNSGVEMVLRTEFEAISLVCVNVFVMISGWFGIKIKIKRLAEFIYQWLFLAVFVVAVLLISGIRFPIGDYKYLIGSYQFYWFIYAYLFLYILSPVLNSFINNSSQKDCKLVLVLYWIFMILFGWIQPLYYIKFGLSPILFIGLYLTARYVHVYRPRWSTHGVKHDLTLFLILTSVSAMIMMLITCCSSSAHLVYKSYGMFMSYVNPLSVLASTYLLLTFSKMKFYSKVVNKVAASAFAVYLLHSNYAVFETYFTKVINIIHTEYSGILYPIITLSFLVAVFILSVLADQLRIYSYAFIAKRAEKKLLNNGRIKNS